MMERKTVAAIALTILCWASSPTGIRIGLTGYGPVHVALMRFVIASLFMCGYAAWSGIRMPLLRDVPQLAALGIFGVTLHHIALNFGQQGISAGAASLLAQSTPLFTAILSSIFCREKLGSGGWAGLLLGLAGIACVVLGDSSEFRFQPTALCVVLAAISWSIYFILQKPLLERYTPLELTCYAVWSGTALMFLFARGLVDSVLHAPLGSTLGLVYLGIFPSALAYLTWSYALARLPVGRTSSLLYLVPPTAMLIAWFVLGETPRPAAFVGGGIVLLGIGLVKASSPAPARPASESEGWGLKR
ncbi:DMT family transporter [Archangium violaceum]|uniref:DMT family transporter n=1 Tax=Archangium violaceum TaxID=83451 RepID=UPI002B2B2375|nr:DMT family transporter [Archangium violaceum]